MIWRYVESFRMYPSGTRQRGEPFIKEYEKRVVLEL